MGKQMRIIVINAAPRMEAGNTQMVLTPFLVGCKSAGAEVDIALLGRKNINPCIGCFNCYAETPGTCIHDDDMVPLSRRIRNADLMVLATPIYLDGMTSLSKIFLDRLVTWLDPHFVMEGDRVLHPLRWKFPSKLFLLSVCGYPGLHNFDPLMLHMERLALNLHAEFCGSLLRPAIFSLLLSRKYPERVKPVMDAIRAAGEHLVRAGSVPEDVRQAAAQDICSTEELLAIANAYWDRELSGPDYRPA
jgi:putative NADPH-quinone reductase